MRHEKIFIRPDGSKVKVIADLYLDSYGSDPAKWRFEAAVCAPRKRTWHFPTSTDDYEYRRLSMGDREKYKIQKGLTVTTPEEVLETQLELWELIKPKLIK